MRPAGRAHRTNQDSGQTSRVMSSGKLVISILSRTCRSLHKLLSPFWFRSIIIHNVQNSHAAVKCLSSTQQAAYVKIPHFKGTAPGKDKRHFRDVQRFPPTRISVRSLAISPVFQKWKVLSSNLTSSRMNRRTRGLEGASKDDL